MQGKGRDCHYAYEFPWGTHIVEWQVDVSQRAVHFFLKSGDFEEVPEGEPVPDMGMEDRRFA
jgi:hypothetical protein